MADDNFVDGFINGASVGMAVSNAGLAISNTQHIQRIAESAAESDEAARKARFDQDNAEWERDRLKAKLAKAEEKIIQLEDQIANNMAAMANLTRLSQGGVSASSGDFRKELAKDKLKDEMAKKDREIAGIAQKLAVTEESLSEFFASQEGCRKVIKSLAGRYGMTDTEILEIFDRSILELGDGDEKIKATKVYEKSKNRSLLGN